MGSKIPKEIRVEVIRKWLQGGKRDDIANEVGIGAGTVSGIIKEYKRDDPDADLLRETALWIKNEGMNIQSFAPLVRLREILKQQKWMLSTGSEQGEQEEEDGGLDHESEKKMESLIMSLEVFCFKRNLTAKEFFDCIYEMYVAAQRLDIPIEEFPYCIRELETLTKDNRITKKEREEFKVRNQKLIQQLVNVVEEKRKYQYDLAFERGHAEDFWSIEEQELEKINEDLGYGSDMVIKPGNLQDMLMDVFYHPSEYGDIISKLMERRINYGYLPLSGSFRRWLSRKK